MSETASDPANYDADAGKTVDDSDVAKARLRLSEQAALMLLIQQVHAKSKFPGGVSLTDKIYKNFGITRLFDVGHINLTNKLYRHESITEFFKGLDPVILNGLQPLVKIFKVFYPQGEGQNKKSFSWQVPFDDIPVPYGNLTSDFLKIKQAKGGDLSNIDAILRGEGRLNGIGIKSFRYAYKGTNPAEINTNIEAELEIYFENIEDLVKKIDVLPGDKRFVQAPPAGTQRMNFSYSDLVAPSSRQVKEDKDSKQKMVPNTQYYRIKVICGYAEPPETFFADLIANKGYDQTKVAHVKSAIRSARIIFWLNPFSHDLSFNEDGSISLKIQYIAAIDNVLANVNALAISPAHAKLIKANEEYKKKLEKYNAEVDAAGCSAGEADRAKAREKEIGKQEKDKFKAEHDVDNLRNQLYSEIYSHILGISGGTGAVESRRAVFKAAMNPEALGINSEGKPLENATHARIQGLAKAAIKSVETVTVLNEKDLKAQSLLRVEPITVPTHWYDWFWPGDDTDTSQKVAKDAPAKQASENSPETATQEGDDFIVKYIFLGDIFDTICESISVSITDPYDKPKIILGEMELNYPTSPLSPGSKNVFDINATYSSKIINIADIPISLSMFQQMFLERVIKPQREFYPLSEFIKDVLTFIVAPAISPSVFGRDKVLSNSARISTLVVSMPLLENETDPVALKNINDNFNGSFTLSEVNKIKPFENMINFSKGIVNYLLMYCSSQLPKGIGTNLGDVEKDGRLGIYHFRCGTDRGILKKVTFSKTQNQFQKEAMASQEGNNSVSVIRDIYDIEATMFGNNIFRPGDYIYIEPVYYIQKSVLDLQSKLGLGGYYVVTDVSTNINENIYETKLKAVLHAFVENGKVIELKQTGDNC